MTSNTPIIEAARRIEDSVFEVPRATDLLGGLVARSVPFWRWLGGIETDLLEERLAEVRIEGPIYICGLARAGRDLGAGTQGGFHRLHGSGEGVGERSDELGIGVLGVSFEVGLQRGGGLLHANRAQRARRAFERVGGAHGELVVARLDGGANLVHGAGLVLRELSDHPRIS